MAIGKNMDGVSDMSLDSETRHEIYKKGQDFALEFLEKKNGKSIFTDYLMFCML